MQLPFLNAYWAVVDTAHHPNPPMYNVVAHVAHSLDEFERNVISLHGRHPVLSGAVQLALLQDLVPCPKDCGAAELGSLLFLWPRGVIWSGLKYVEQLGTSGASNSSNIRGYCGSCGVYVDSVFDKALDDDLMRAIMA